MYSNDTRVVMTLDAGGTNFVFSAIQGNKEIVTPVCLSASPADLDGCMASLKKGFTEIKNQLVQQPVAISFAFPGPADYENGVIGDLPNFPAFRGGIPLGAYLEEIFQIPVYINNDGNLFAYGEAIAGALPEVNRRLKQAGSSKQYKNLLGLTFGTGFGAGVVINNILLTGDNGCGGDVWVFRNKKYPNLICEESVSIRAVKRIYAQYSNENADIYSPKDIFEIAEGLQPGNRQAALRSFEEFGEVAGNTISQALTIADGLVVIGGGLAGASKYIMPSLLKEMNGEIAMFSGDIFPRLQMKAYNLDDAEDFERFAENTTKRLHSKYAKTPVNYNTAKKTGVCISKLGASYAIALGAYGFALASIDNG